MVKKILVFFCLTFFMANLYGCFLLLAGAAGGVGTASWLSGKLVQEVNAPFDSSLKATRSALKSLKLDIVKETVAGDVAQVRSNYTDGRNLWVDIHRVTRNASRLEVRVGALSDRQAAQKVLDRILAYL